MISSGTSRVFLFFLGVCMGNHTHPSSLSPKGNGQRNYAKLIDLRRRTFVFGYSVFKRFGFSGPWHSLPDFRSTRIRRRAPTRGAPTLGRPDATDSTQLCTLQTAGVPATDSITRIRRVFSAFSGRCNTRWGRSYVAENLCPQGQELFCGFRRGTGQAQGLPLRENEVCVGEEGLYGCARAGTRPAPTGE